MREITAAESASLSVTDFLKPVLTKCKHGTMNTM